MTIETAFWILLALLVAVSVWTLLRLPRPSPPTESGELSTPPDEGNPDGADDGPDGPLSSGSDR